MRSAICRLLDLLRHVFPVIGMGIVGVLGLGGSARAELPTWQALEAARTEWLQTVTFRSTYVYRDGIAESVEAAFDGEPFDSVASTAHGLLHKRGSLVHHALEFEGGPRIVGTAGEDQRMVPLEKGAEPDENAKLRFVGNAGFAELYDEEKILTYNPQWGDVCGQVRLEDRRHRGRVDDRRPTQTEMHLNPLAPVPGSMRGFPAAMQGKNAPAEYRVSESPDGGIAMEGEWATPDGFHQYLVEWSRESKIPVIRRIRREWWQGDRLKAFAEMRSSDFRDVGGLAVPSHVICVLGPTTDEQVFVREWKSDDIGNGPPTDSDFIVKAPSTTPLLGFGNPPVGRELLQLSLEGVQGLEAAPTARPPERSVEANASINAANPAVRPDSPEPLGIQWLIGAVIALVAGMGASFWCGMRYAARPA